MIYFVRHGSTDWNEHKNSLGVRDPKCQGHADIELNELGKKQATETAQSLKGIEFDRVICSPLKRAKQTLDIIYTGDTPIEIDERVKERDFGEFEGLTRTEFDFNGFWEVTANQKFESAEGLEDFKARVFSLLDELKQNPNQKVLIVSHGGVGCVVQSYFKGVPTNGNFIKSYEVPHGKPLILEF